MKNHILTLFFAFYSLIAISQNAENITIYISVKQDCSNCNLIAYTYKEISKKYPVTLVFGGISSKEVKTYIKEVIMLSDNTKYITSDSILKRLDDFLSSVGSFVYAFKGNTCVYASSLKTFNFKKMESILLEKQIKYDTVTISDTISLVSFSSCTANEKYYAVYNYTLKKAYIFTLPDYKLESIISPKQFNDEHIWKVLFKDTTDLYLARDMSQQAKKIIPNYEMISIDGITCSKHSLFIWISITTPKLFIKTGKKDILYRTYLLVKYDSKGQFSYYPLDEVVDKENKLVAKYIPNPATYTVAHPLFSGNAIIIDSLIYLHLSKELTQKDRPDYPMAIYKFEKNKLAFIDFYKVNLPELTTFQNVSNSFYASYFSDFPLIYYSLSPYYLNVSEQKLTVLPFLPKQHIVLNDNKSTLWNINFVHQKLGSTLVCYWDNVFNQQYIVKLNQNISMEKYIVHLPKSASNWVVIHNSITAIDDNKEKLLKISLSDI